MVRGQCGCSRSRFVSVLLKCALVAIVGVFVAAFITPRAQAEDSHDLLVVRDVKRPFADVRTDLQNAIINQGLKVDLNGHIGDMLKRTAADIGAKGDLYTEAEYFTFCSSRLSRAMMEADPVNMGLCPYTMFVYQKTGSDDVTVGYKAMVMRGDEKSQTTLKEINALLQSILDEAAE
ncbi:MAG: DUF302 domain-containing protein [Hyphomicrobiaceae bacterium]|nr:DUF302 domain-containing protein [Hyphomicrobiaceae bacterium]